MEQKNQPKAKADSAVAEKSPKVQYPELEGIEEFILKAFNNKDQQPVTARPCEDKTGRVFTGQGPTGHYETLSEEDKRRLSYVITPETSVVLTDNKVMSVLSTVDMANWAWLRRHPYIVLDKEKGHSSRDAVFYLYNPINEADRRVKATRTRDKVRYLIQYELNQDQLISAAKVMGDLGAEAKTLSQLQDYLLGLAEFGDNAKNVLDAINPENSSISKAKILYTELQQYRLLQRGENGLIRFNGEKGRPLGQDENAVLEFMMDVKNDDLIHLMKQTLNKAKNLPDA